MPHNSILSRLFPLWHFRALFLYLFILLAFGVAPSLFVPANAQAFSIFNMQDEDNRKRAWTLNAGRMSSLAGGDILEAYDNVEMRMGDDYLIADYARYYTKTNWIYLSGNVRVRMGSDELTAKSAEFNLESRTGWLTDGVIFLEGPHAYFAGERINKHWGDVYSFNNATITACDGDTPAWSFSADSAVVEIDGYAQLWGTSFRVMDTPVIYSPYMIVPAKTERQTGFLAPDWGHSSSQGYFYNQPFFWAIDSSRDLTINEYYMSNRGFMHGATYRSRGSEDEKLWLRADYLSDRTRITNDSQGDYSGDGLVRTNSERWWIRGMYDWRVPMAPLWRLRADIDLVSDQDFLKEYDKGISSFEHSRAALFDDFSRDLQEKDLDRVSGAMIFREWDRASLFLSGRYQQNPKLGNGNTPRYDDNTVQTLPSLDVFVHKGRIIQDLPFEFEASAQAAYKYRREGTSGVRWDFVPKLSLPLTSEYGSIIASTSLRSTWYNTEATSYANDAKTERVKSDSNRHMVEVDVQASSEVSRVYEFQYDDADFVKPGDSRWLAAKHSIVPRVAYYNRPSVDQTGNPNYDSYDRIDKQNELVYSLENTLTRKRERMLVRTNEDGSEENYTQIDYLDMLRLRLEQTYNIHESKRDDERDAYERRPFRDIIAELYFSWDGVWGLNSKSYWSPYSGNINRHEHGVNLNLPDWGTFYTGLDFWNKVEDDYYTRRDSRLTRLSFRADMDLYGPFSSRFYYYWPLHGNAKEEMGLELIYNHQCFQLLTRFYKDEDDKTLMFFFVLGGGGSLGSPMSVGNFSNF